MYFTANYPSGSQPTTWPTLSPLGVRVWHLVAGPNRVELFDVLAVAATQRLDDAVRAVPDEVPGTEAALGARVGALTAGGQTLTGAVTLVATGGVHATTATCGSFCEQYRKD